jgi:hypothetical protein
VNTILPSSTGRVRTWSTTIVAMLSGVGAGLTAALAVFPVGKVAGALLTVFVGLVFAFVALAISDSKSRCVRHLTAALVLALALPVTLGIRFSILVLFVDDALDFMLKLDTALALIPYLLAAIVYAPGTLLYLVARRVQGLRVFSRAEAMACALLMISAVLGVVLISTDSLDV